MIFFQIWKDFRLKYEHILPENLPNKLTCYIILPNDVSQKLWKAKLYFPLAREGSVQEIVKPSSKIVVSSNGKIETSDR